MRLEPIIRTKNLVKIFKQGNTHALDGVSIEIMPGEFCCIIGHSGSGKSTLLNMLAGLDAPTSGSVVVAGKHIEHMKETELVDFRLKNIGFVFQSYNLFATHTALENVAMPLMYRGVSKRTRLARARKMMIAVGLKKYINHKASNMSGGQQQRVGIARALVSKPKIIFADEPTGNLDSRTSKEILKLMTDTVHENGTTLIVVTHDPEMSQYADRVIKIKDGLLEEMHVNEHPLPVTAPPPLTESRS